MHKMTYLKMYTVCYLCNTIIVINNLINSTGALPELRFQIGFNKYFLNGIFVYTTCSCF